MKKKRKEFIENIFLAIWIIIIFYALVHSVSYTIGKGFSAGYEEQVYLYRIEYTACNEISKFHYLLATKQRILEISIEETEKLENYKGGNWSSEIIFIN